MQQEIGKICKVISAGHRFLVMGHKNVDGDAYGSSMALYFYLQNLGKTVEVVNELPITPLFHFLDVHPLVTKSIQGQSFDAIFICDCGERELIGRYPELAPDIFGDTPIISIDHHNGNKMFGTYNLVDTEASSTCEILYDLLQAMGHGMSIPVATLLLFGIIRDTNCFKNSIRPHTFEVTSGLIALGAEYEDVIFHSYKSEKLHYLKLYGHVLDTLISLKGGAIVGGYISQDTFKRYGILETELGPQLINEVLSSLDGSDFAFLIKETEDGNMKLSLRARKDTFNVSKIARTFGGGGHMFSAGAYTDKPLHEILRVIEETDVKMG